MFHLSLRSDTDISLAPTLWHRCFTCPYALTQMLHLSLRSDTDVSLVPTLWHRCFTFPYALTQMFHFSLRSETDFSLVATFWQMFHLSLRSDTVVSLFPTFRHRCFTCHQFHAPTFSRMSLRWHTCWFTSSHALALILFNLAKLETQRQNISIWNKVRILFSSTLSFTKRSYAELKFAPKFQKYQWLN